MLSRLQAILAYDEDGFYQGQLYNASVLVVTIDGSQIIRKDTHTSTIITSHPGSMLSKGLDQKAR